MLYLSHPPRDNNTGDPNGIRTRVTAVKGRCPGPLDDRVVQGERNMAVRAGCAREKCAGNYSAGRSGKRRTPVQLVSRDPVNSATPDSWLLAPDYIAPPFSR